MQHPLHPHGPPVHEFFGRRYLRSNELISIGLAPNRITLNRMIRAGQFPAPLRLTPRVLLWDSTEIAALIDRLAGERGKDTGEAG
jgi:predicted DNA-binding transcriptional regulator AlpA